MKLPTVEQIANEITMGRADYWVRAQKGELE